MNRTVPVLSEVDVMIAGSNVGSSMPRNNLGYGQGYACHACMGAQCADQRCFRPPTDMNEAYRDRTRSEDRNILSE